MSAAAVSLFWLPLGAGGRSVRWNGRVFEAVVARHEGRSTCDLYHSALEVRLGQDRWTIEMAPAWSGAAEDRGVVTSGPVGRRWLGRSVLFRYEVRVWPDGVIPDLAEAVGGARTVPTDEVRVRRLLAAAPDIPALVWGADELNLGEMWNSNSVVAWLLRVSGHDVRALGPPPGGRAPGWGAGVRLAEPVHLTSVGPA